MTRKEAKKLIESLVKLRNLATDEMSLQVPNLYPIWKPNVRYSFNDKILYDDILYKVITPHISQETWTPDIASSLFSKILISDANVVSNWEQPNSTNVYAKGDKVKHNGKIWISDYDNNSWEPGIFGWSEFIEN